LPGFDRQDEPEVYFYSRNIAEWKMMTDNAGQGAYADQIAEVIKGFVQVWTKFESMVHAELASSQGGREGIHAGTGPHSHADYGFFYRVSSSIAQRESLTMGELSAALSVPLSTATRIVDWLVANGYACRLPDRKDRRIVRVALTEEGRQLHQIVERFTRERVQQILACLREEEMAQLLALIRKVLVALREAAG